ncbi:MAG: peptidase S41, partial [Deltaproteobacteria bacterium]
DIKVDFVPPTEKKETKKPHFLREEDLKGHMENDGAVQKKDKEEEPQEKDERVEDLLKNDNQVRYALQLLESWEIFSKIRAAP